MSAPQPDNPGPGYSRLCMVCQQRPGRGEWMTCAPCVRRLRVERGPNPWWVTFTPLRFIGWVKRRWF